REVYDTIDERGLTEILNEYGPRLARLPPDLTIPAYDLEFESREDLTSALQDARESAWTGSRHRELLEAAEATRHNLMEEASRARGQTDGSARAEDSTMMSRWFGPSLRILAGTGLAAANAAVGVTAGLTATVATIGATTVPTYVGVVTSVYTGLA